MSSNDEFENLIRNFKLDDLDGQTKAAPQRPVFDYETDQSRQPHPQQTRMQSQPRAQTPMQQRPASASTGVQTVQPRMQHTQTAVHPRSAAASDPTGGRPPRRGFQVNIDEREFYKPSMAGGAAPPKDPRGKRDYEDDDDDDDEGGAGGRWAKAIIALIAVVGVSIFLAIFALESASDLFGLNKPDAEVEFTLPENLSLSETTKLLKEEGIITQPFTFKIYAALKKQGDNFIPGNYILNKNMSYDQIFVKFRTGSRKLVERSVTLIEGWTLSEIANKLEEENIVSADALYEYLETADFPWDYDFIAQVPDDGDRFRRWEGYFFPDTYTFYEESSPEVVVKKFFQNFAVRLGNDDLKAAIDKSGMTLDQVITLASVIQREAGHPEDMGTVSSVFHNRLSQGSQVTKLQSDVTRDYVNNYIKPFLPDAVDKEKDPNAKDPNQAMYDAYNTYVCEGLPIGPVCNPGLAAIKAALKPDDTNYYYFVTDETGVYYYAQTLAEHDQNVAKAAAVGEGKVHGTDTKENVPT